MKLEEIRKKFLDYFLNKNHKQIKSDSLIPKNDDTLLFTNAGMVQFKNLFLNCDGSFNKAVSIQKCLRAGGKHNDLDLVGYTARHHTFFEMLGNFSFGDYFKERAIEYAWDFLTNILKIPANRLFITILKTDLEAEDIWINKIGISRSKIFKKDKDDNFWAMGNFGPCGPCSEIFYNHFDGNDNSIDYKSEEFLEKKCVEIWNIVFMEYFLDINGTLSKLEKPSIDTGMGLERIASVLQNVKSNYEIDLFKNLIKHIAQELQITDVDSPSIRVIADHVRSCSFLISEGIIPTNEGRGYVLRRIIRRAIRHGINLGINEEFFYKIPKFLITLMKGEYNELSVNEGLISSIIYDEEKQFSKTLKNGIKYFNDNMELFKKSENTVSGEFIFKLYDTYGFPVDFSKSIADENLLKFDFDGFKIEMEKQKNRGRANRKFFTSIDMIKKPDNNKIMQNKKTIFLRDKIIEKELKVILILKSDMSNTDILSEGEDGYLILDKTIFYPELGGQVSDTGFIDNSSVNKFKVDNVIENENIFLHKGIVKNGFFKINDIVNISVDSDKREKIKKNHTATHLLHSTLKNILGDHIIQKGSYIDDYKFRFDFSHPNKLDQKVIKKVESLINLLIINNLIISKKNMTFDEAKKNNIIGQFEEKYNKNSLNTISIGDYSKEICGGAHVDSTGEIGIFKIISEVGISSGVRRITAITGYEVYKYMTDNEDIIKNFCDKLKSDKNTVSIKLDKVIFEKNKLIKKIIGIRKEYISNYCNLIECEIIKKGYLNYIVKLINPLYDESILKDLIFRIKFKRENMIAFFAEKVGREFLFGVSVNGENCLKKFSAYKIIEHCITTDSSKYGGNNEIAFGKISDLNFIEKLNKIKLFIDKNI